MSQDVFFGFSLPVALAFAALVLLVILMMPALARELAVLRHPPRIRMPAPPLAEPADAPALPTPAGR